jgi:hypothetical protein
LQLGQGEQRQPAQRNGADQGQAREPLGAADLDVFEAEAVFRISEPFFDPEALPLPGDGYAAGPGR